MKREDRNPTVERHPRYINGCLGWTNREVLFLNSKNNEDHHGITFQSLANLSKYIYSKTVGAFFFT